MRPIRQMVDMELKSRDVQLQALHSAYGRESIPPEQVLRADLARQFFAQVLGQAEQADLLSKEHCSVDGTMIEALASLESCRSNNEDEPLGAEGGYP